MRRLLPFSLVLAVAAQPGWASALETISIGLWDSARAPARVRVAGARIPQEGTARVWTVTASGGRLHVEPGGRAVTRLTLRGSPRMIITGPGASAAVPGELVLSARHGRMQGILKLPLEEYVARVVAREMPSGWPPDALAAQAVVARSFALASKGRHARDGFDVCSLTHCQLWSASPPTAQATEAARRTKGWILTSGGQTLRAPFCSTCGGYTADGAASGLPATCVPVRDGLPGREFCRASPHFRWQARLSPQELGRLAGLAEGRAAEIRILARDKGGRVTRARLAAEQMDGGALLIRFGRALGWARVKSCLFTLRKEGPVTVLDGRGLGHGAGLCQWGARGRALQGQDWKGILRAYFPKAELVRR
ncbi:MAG: cell division protein [Armatimonadota bacterium]|nr:MAG: cell division protein [Armatimonadota bacterium]